MYSNGEGALDNDALAVKWYRKAADQGHASAQFNLGLMYANGEGVPENNIRAYVWWSMSKTQGIALAAKNIDILKPMLTPKQLAAGQALAAKCYESNYKDCE
jgi:TPR repeat protein